MFVSGNILYGKDGKELGSFSSHWAACAAMIRKTNPYFRSLTGDKKEDLVTEERISGDEYGNQTVQER